MAKKTFKIGAAAAAIVWVLAFLGDHLVGRFDRQSGQTVKSDPCEVDGGPRPRCPEAGGSDNRASAGSRLDPVSAGEVGGLAAKRAGSPTPGDQTVTARSHLRGITSEIVGSLHPDHPEDPDRAEPVKVAFIADQGNSRAAHAVLRMIKAQGADMVLHQGDFDYEDDPRKWDISISHILGTNFPYFASIGNHDLAAWHGSDGYQAMLEARLARVRGAHCSGDLGVMSACRYKGLFFVLSGIGTLPDDKPDEARHIEYLSDQLAATKAIWRICSWHKNQRQMQTGKKTDEVGWKAYEVCRKAGAIIATGHEHAYARTHLMESFRNQTIQSYSNTLVLNEGASFAFVSGLGGHSIRPLAITGDWWAKTYTKEDDADHGSLFCTFNVGGDSRRAECYFQDIRGRVVDGFNIINSIGRNSLLGAADELQ